MDEAEPAVGSLACARYVAVGVSILKRLPDARHQKCGDEERERRCPGAQRLGSDLERCTEDEQGAEVEALAEVGVGEGGEGPAEEVGGVAGKGV